MSLVDESGDSHDVSSIDQVLQDTWLLVLAIRNGKTLNITEELHRACHQRILQTQKIFSVQSEGIADDIAYAECAILDETILSNRDHYDVAVWYRNPLQGVIFGSLRAGDKIPEKIKELLRKPSPSPLLLTVYLRLLQLGFRGRFNGENDPERLELMRKLEKELPSDKRSPEFSLPIIIRAGQRARWRVFYSPWLWLGGAIIFSLAMWLGLRTFLITHLVQGVTG